MSEPDDKPKRSPLRKKRYWALAIIVIIIAAAASSGSKKGTGSTSPSAAANASASSSPALANTSASSSRTTSAAPTSHLTLSQQNAVNAAKNYLSLEGFSKQGLIHQLCFPPGTSTRFTTPPWPSTACTSTGMQKL